MNKILCATRGGEASRVTQEKAIALAKERGDALVFLYVVDLRFLDKTAAPIIVNVEDELTEMAGFLLLMAKERAAAQGVPTETVIRKGELRQELALVAREKGASLIVFGRPMGAKSAFQLPDLESFTAAIETETGIKTRIIDLVEQT